MNMKFLFLYPLFFITCLYGDLSTHFKKFASDPTKNNQIKQIDYVYLINLDQRPEKRKKVLSKLEPYGISPFHFPAIYGWDLSIDALNDIGLKFRPGMLKNKWVWQYCTQNDGPQEEFLRDGLYGNTYYCRMTPGAIGCTLSHLSVLQNAYDAGYETIWILEDEIILKKEPHTVSNLIEK